jgi:hypothetical protein
MLHESNSIPSSVSKISNTGSLCKQKPCKILIFEKTFKIFPFHFLLTSNQHSISDFCTSEAFKIENYWTYVMNYKILAIFLFEVCERPYFVVLYSYRRLFYFNLRR